MTTIAFKGGIVASDRRMNSNGVLLCEGSKIVRNARGDVAAGCGSLNKLGDCFRWFLDGEKNADFRPYLGPLDMFVIFRADGVTLDHFSTDGRATNGTMQIRRDQPFIAFGSGAMAALGAMACGKSAREAIEIAARFDCFTGEGVDTLAVGVKVRRARK